jgi:hypothetical protein
MLSKSLASLILCSTIYLLSVVAVSLSQSNAEPGLDSLVDGKKFRVTLYNDKEIIGRVIRQDSLYAFMVTGSGTVRIKKDDIFSISKNTEPKIIKALFSVGGGLLFESNYHNGYGNNRKPGYSLQLSGAVPLSETKAVRFDLGYGRVMLERVTYANYSGNEYSTIDQSRSIYSLNADVIFADFNTATDFSIYGLAGLGAVHVNESGYSFTYYSSYDSTYRTENYKGYNETYFSLALGGGLKFRIKSKIGAYIEAQYNMFTYAGFFWFFGSGYFPVRAGITYSLY